MACLSLHGCVVRRGLHRAHLRVRMGNYALSGLVGFEFRNKVVGVIGTGAIGTEACRMLQVSANTDLSCAYT